MTGKPVPSLSQTQGYKRKFLFAVPSEDALADALGGKSDMLERILGRKQEPLFPHEAEKTSLTFCDTKNLLFQRHGIQITQSTGEDEHYTNGLNFHRYRLDDVWNTQTRMRTDWDAIIPSVAELHGKDLRWIGQHLQRKPTVTVAHQRGTFFVSTNHVTAHITMRKMQISSGSECKTCFEISSAKMAGFDMEAYRQENEESSPGPLQTFLSNSYDASKNLLMTLKQITPLLNRNKTRQPALQTDHESFPGEERDDTIRKDIDAIDQAWETYQRANYYDMLPFINKAHQDGLLVSITDMPLPWLKGPSL